MPDTKRSRKTPENPVQPGGIYTGYFTPEEDDFPLERLLRSNLEDEIAVLRLAIVRMWAVAEGTESLVSVIKVLGALGLACSRVAALLKTQKELAGDTDEVAQALSRALASVTQELKRKP
jgi:hypothetical protein